MYVTAQHLKCVFQFYIKFSRNITIFHRLNDNQSFLHAHELRFKTENIPFRDFIINKLIVL